MAERRRSRSAPSRAWSMSSASVSRSMATAAWLPTASSRRLLGRRRAHGLRGWAARRSRRPAERLVRIGTNSQRPPGKVSVPRPVGRSASHDQRAAARSASLERRRRAERRRCRSSWFRSSRHQDHDLGVQQSRQVGDDDPQQVVEVDDAGDLAAEGIELGGGARLAPRRLGLRARARGERAGGDRHEHEEEQRHDVGRVGDGELVERRQEEEVVGRARSEPETQSDGTSPWRAAATRTGTTKSSEMLGRHDAAGRSARRRPSPAPSSSAPSR